MAKNPSTSVRSGRVPTVEETSAGGIVLDLTHSPVRAALIGRLDRRGRIAWSLPKGHLEAGESPAQAAVREVREETGIEGEVRHDLGTIDFWFMADQRRIHKTVHHFVLEAVGGELSHDDIEVVESRWFDLDEVADVLAYSDERTLVARARTWLDEHPQAQA